MDLPLIAETLLPIKSEDLESLIVIPPDKNNQIGIVFDNFLREELVLCLIKSIFKYAPGVKLYISDQSIYHRNTDKLYSKLREAGHEITYCGFDCGISVARNRSIYKVKEPYIFLCDGDNLFSEKTNLNALLDILNKYNNIGLISLLESRNGEVHHYEINIELENNMVKYEDVHKDTIIRRGDINWCDYTLNTGLCRKELFNEVSYDEEMKLAEHLDFFMQIKYKSHWKVATALDIEIQNQNLRIDDPVYKAYRTRNKLYWSYYIKKWNITHIAGLEFKLSGPWKIPLLPPQEIKKETTSSVIKEKKIITKKKERISSKELLNIFSDLMGDFDLWFLNQSCLEIVNHHEIKSNRIYLGVRNEEIKLEIEKILKEKLNSDIEFEISVEPKRQLKIYDSFKVPFPVITYLRNIFGPNWQEL